MKTKTFLAAILVISLLSVATSTVVAVDLPPLTPYSENFDTLASSGTSSVVPPGWAFTEAGSNADTTYTAGTGSSNAGDTYSFGASGSTERAFGGLASGNLQTTIGVSFTNKTGGTIGALAIAYNCEQWRMGDTALVTDTLNFQYSVDATSLTDGTWIDFDDLNCQSTDTTTGAAGARDGNTIRTPLAETITGLSIANDGIFWLRWVDVNIAGIDDGLAIDDFVMNEFTATAVAFSGLNATSPFAALAVGLLAATGLVVLRKRK